MFRIIKCLFFRYSPLTVPENTEKVNKISYESKKSNIEDLSLIFMHFNRNLNTVFYAVIAVGYGKEYFRVFTKISLFCYFQHGEKRKKSVADHESSELIESYSAQPVTVRVIFDYHAIYKLNSSTLRSIQPLLTDGPHYIFYLFLSMTCSASTLQLLQIFQFLCFIVVITFLAPAGAVSDMVGFSLLVH